MGNKLNQLGENKYFVNKGVKRNKKPLRNLVYTVKLTQIEGKDEKYKYKDEGYIVLSWHYEGNDVDNWHGFITPEDLKELIGLKQWGKFCQGKGNL